MEQTAPDPASNNDRAAATTHFQNGAFDPASQIFVNWPDVDLIRVAANGIHFEVATMGSGDRLALCLHGFPEHAYSWRYQMPMLARLGYRVWAPNLRGYGNTDSP